MSQVQTPDRATLQTFRDLEFVTYMNNGVTFPIQFPSAWPVAQRQLFNIGIIGLVDPSIGLAVSKLVDVLKRLSQVETDLVVDRFLDIASGSNNERSQRAAELIVIIDLPATRVLFSAMRATTLPLEKRKKARELLRRIVPEW